MSGPLHRPAAPSHAKVFLEFSGIPSDKNKQMNSTDKFCTTATRVTTIAEQDVSEPPRRTLVKPIKRILVHISGQDVPDCPCELVGIDAGMVYVRSERQIPESSVIVVSFDHVQLSGVVSSCQPAEQDWVISIALASCKRRLDERIPEGEESAVGVIDNGPTKMLPCTIINTSGFGLGLRLSFPIPMGARVCVERETMMLFGEVRHCHPKPDGQYIAGILIIDVVHDLRSQSAFSVMLNNLRWKLASTIRGRDVPGFRLDH